LSFVRVAFVIDAIAKRIVGGRLSRTAHTSFVFDALEQAPHERRSMHCGPSIIAVAACSRGREVLKKNAVTHASGA
jgi:hypothetical protein